jgi:hypothetical protein
MSARTVTDQFGNYYTVGTDGWLSLDSDEMTVVLSPSEVEEAGLVLRPVVD